MWITDLFGDQPDERMLSVTRQTDDQSVPAQAVLNEEHELKLYCGEKLLHTFICSPAQLGELCAGWLFSAGYTAQSVTVAKDGKTARAEGLLSVEKNAAKAPVAATTAEMLALFDQASDKYARSHGVHECVIRGEDWHLLRTDIGRHNAIDKAVGAALVEGRELSGTVMFSSGRINEQTVQKAVRCGVGCLMSKAVITRQALELAETLGLKVLFSVKGSGYLTK